MIYPRQASTTLLALLTLACFVTALPLTRASEQNSSSKKSPNGQIVFQSTRAGGFVNEIYVMDEDGKHETRLTYNNADDANPIWSPQGDKIAFVSDRGGTGYNIYVMDADGSNQHPLRSATAGGPLFGDNIEWSPDGKKIKYDLGGKIYVVKLMASNGRASTAPPQDVSAAAPVGAFDNAADWSPDGSKFTFISTECSGCSPHVYTMNADGTRRTQVTNSPGGFEANPRWSPTGAPVIAYESFSNNSRDIYVANADGTNQRLVSGAVGSVGSPAWSPDGKRIAFRSFNSNIYAAKANGNGLTLLSDMTSDTGEIFWSPDGDMVAFHNTNDNGCVDIFIVSSDGNSRRATNYTKTKRADEFALSWQRLQTR